MRWKEIIEDHKIELYEACFEAKHKAITEKCDYYVTIYNNGDVEVQKIIDVESYDDGSMKLIYEATKDIPIKGSVSVEELNEICIEQNDHFREVISNAIDE